MPHSPFGFFRFLFLYFPLSPQSPDPTDRPFPALSLSLSLSLIPLCFVHIALHPSSVPAAPSASNPTPPPPPASKNSNSVHSGGSRSTGMAEKEPLLPYSSPRRRPPPLPPLSTLPEHDEISIPLPMTPSEFKDRLIFGPSPSARDASQIVDALTFPVSSPRPSSSENLFTPPESSCIDSKSPGKKKCLHRAKTAPAMAVLDDRDRQPAPPKPQFGSQSIIRQAVILLIAYLAFGVVIYWLNRRNFNAVETHPVVDALYFCIVTMCTIGYGDITPDTTATKMFSIMFVLVGFGFIDILLSGMVSYVLDLQESYMLRAAQDRTEKKESGKSYIIDVKKGRMRIRMKVALALGVVVLCIGIGMVVLHFLESLGWMDSFYLSVMSVTTVGYGDRTFKSLPGRIFACIWLLVSTLAVARAFLYFAEARVDKRQRRVAKWVLGHDMTISEFLAADIDNNGFVSKSEYVIYKLKEMGKVSDKDILQICNTFDRLDAGNCGKISLADLMQTQR